MVRLDDAGDWGGRLLLASCFFAVALPSELLPRDRDDDLDVGFLPTFWSTTRISREFVDDSWVEDTEVVEDDDVTSVSSTDNFCSSVLMLPMLPPFENKVASLVLFHSLPSTLFLLFLLLESVFLLSSPLFLSTTSSILESALDKIFFAYLASAYCKKLIPLIFMIRSSSSKPLSWKGESPSIPVTKIIFSNWRNERPTAWLANIFSASIVSCSSTSSSSSSSSLSHFVGSLNDRLRLPSILYFLDCRFWLFLVALLFNLLSVRGDTEREPRTADTLAFLTTTVTFSCAFLMAFMSSSGPSPLRILVPLMLRTMSPASIPESWKSPLSEIFVTNTFPCLSTRLMPAFWSGLLFLTVTLVRSSEYDSVFIGASAAMISLLRMMKNL